MEHETALTSAIAELDTIEKSLNEISVPFEDDDHIWTPAERVRWLITNRVERLRGDYSALRVSFENLQRQLLIEGHAWDCACVQAASVDCSCGARKI